MGQLCAVTFNRYGRLFYVDPGELRPAIGDHVLVPTDDGSVIGECVWTAEWVDHDTSVYPRLRGFAAETDFAHDRAIRRAKAEANVAARRLIRMHDLPMKVVAVDHVSNPGDSTAVGADATSEPSPLGSGPRTIIYFTAPHRVDFRALVRDLGATLRCRVELRQLSARDSARVQGGIGSCGRELCCSTFLTDFESVTIRMAKDQDLPLNPLRISGACGRLMCCLKYEHPLYQSFHATAPAISERVETPQGSGRVVGHAVPRDAVVVRLDSDGSRSICSRASVCQSRKAYEARQPTTDVESSTPADSAEEDIVRA